MLYTHQDKVYRLSLISLTVIISALLIFIYFLFKGNFEKFKIKESRGEVGKKFFYEGWNYYKKQEYEKAVDKFKKAIKLIDKNDFRYKWAYEELIYLLRKLKRYKEAEDILKEDIKMNPRYSLYYTELINLYIYMRRYEDAYEVAMIAKDIFKEDVCIQSLYGFVLNHNKEYKEAEKVLKNIFERGLSWRCEEVAYFELAYTYYKTKREKEGDLILVKYYQGDEDIVDEVKKKEKDFASRIVDKIPFPWERKSLKRKPTNLELLELKSQVFLKHEPEETIKICKLILKKYPKRLKTLKLLAQTYDFTGDKPSARKTYQKILEINPNDKEAKRYLLMTH